LGEKLVWRGGARKRRHDADVKAGPSKHGDAIKTINI
jgi:hypothetical protein